MHVSFDDGAVVSASPVGGCEEAALAEHAGARRRARAGPPARDRGPLDAEDEKLPAPRGPGGGARRARRRRGRGPRHARDALQGAALECGSFRAAPRRCARATPTRRAPAEQILMDGLRMVDEWRELDPDARRAEAIFRAWTRSRPTASRRAARRNAAHRARAAVRADRRQRSVRRAIDLSLVGSFEGARILTAMRRAGTIEPIASDGARGAGPRASRGRGAGRLLRGSPPSVRRCRSCCSCSSRRSRGARRPCRPSAGSAIRWPPRAPRAPCCACATPPRPTGLPTAATQRASTSFAADGWRDDPRWRGPRPARTLSRSAAA